MDETLRLPSGYVEMFSEYLKDESPTRGVDEMKGSHPSFNHWISFYLWWLYHRKLKDDFNVFKDFIEFFNFVLQYKSHIIYFFKMNNNDTPEFIFSVRQYLKEFPRKCFSVIYDYLKACKDLDDPLVPPLYREQFSTEAYVFFQVKMYPEYGDLKFNVLETHYRTIFKNLVRNNPSLEKVDISNLYTLPETVQIVNFGSFSERNSEILRRYIATGLYVRDSPEYQTFIRLCEILNIHFKDPIFIFVCLSSGMGKSQLPFSITDFPLLYFCMDFESSNQDIYKPFTALSKLLNNYISMDLAQYLRDHPHIRLDSDRHLGLDYRVLKDSKTEYWVLGLIVALLKKIMSDSDGSIEGLWIERELVVEEIAITPLSPAQANAELRKCFKASAKFPLVFVDECLKMNYRLKFLRNILRACGITPILMGTNAHAKNFCGSLSIGGSRCQGDPWCMLITKLARFSASLIDTRLYDKFKDNEAVCRLLNLLPSQRPWLAHSVLGELLNSQADCSVASILGTFRKDFYYSKLDKNPEGVDEYGAIKMQFFFHGFTLLTTVKVPADFDIKLINCHLAHLKTPESNTGPSQCRELFEFLKLETTKMVVTPLYLCPDVNGSDPSSRELEAIADFFDFSNIGDIELASNIATFKANGGLFYYDARGHLKPFYIRSSFGDYSHAYDRVSFLSLLGGSNIDSTVLYYRKRYTSFEALCVAREIEDFSLRNMNGTYLEVLTGISAAIASRAREFEKITFKSWLINFMGELSYYYNYNAPMSIIFESEPRNVRLKPEPKSRSSKRLKTDQRKPKSIDFCSKILDSLFVPYTFFPNASPHDDIKAIIQPNEFGEIYVSTNNNTVYDAKMTIQRKNDSGGFDSCQIYFECKSRSGDVGVSDITGKMRSFAVKIDPLPPIIIFVVNNISQLTAQSFSEFDSSFFKLSAVRDGSFIFENLQIGSQDDIVLIIDLSVLNQNYLSKLDVALRC